MSDTIKATSFRVNEEDIEKFKEFAQQNGFNQAEAFKSMMNTVEIAKAKEQIKDRAKEIETFQDLNNRLVNMFLNSLELNMTSEERIRETFSKELNSKDNIIKDLQEKVDTLNDGLKSASKAEDEAIKENITLQKSLDKAEKELFAKENSIKSLEDQLATLNEIVTEFKSYKSINTKLEDENKKLKENHTIEKAAIKELNLQIKNITEQRDFFKKQIDELKHQNSVVEQNLGAKESYYKADIKELKEKYDKKLEELEEKYDKKLKEKTKELEERFKEKISSLEEKHKFEIEKKEFEIEKLKSLSQQPTTLKG